MVLITWRWNRPFPHFWPGSKIMFLHVYIWVIPLKWAKGSLFMQSSMKIKHIFPLNLYKIKKIVIICEFYKYSNYTQIIVLSITFC